jgi:hypothetical protein
LSFGLPFFVNFATNHAQVDRQSTMRTSDSDEVRECNFTQVRKIVDFMDDHYARRVFERPLGHLLGYRISPHGSHSSQLLARPASVGLEHLLKVNLFSR